MAQHNDRKVRELIYIPLNILLLNNINNDILYNTIIDQIIVNWLLHQYDASNEVKRVANNLFNNVFKTLEQQIDVLVRCNQQYIDKIQQMYNDYLNNENSNNASSSNNSSSDHDSDSDNSNNTTIPKQHSPNVKSQYNNNQQKSDTTQQQQSQSELQSQQQQFDDETNEIRLLISSTSSLSAYINKLGTTLNQQYIQQYEKLLFESDDNNNSTLIQLLTHNISNVRKSAYTLLQALIDKLTTLVNKHSSTLNSIIIDITQDTDKSNLHTLYEVIVMYIYHEQTSFWSYIDNNNNKFVLLLDNILNAISTSYQGYDQPFYDMCFSIIAVIPYKYILQCNIHYYIDFINSIWQSKDINRYNNVTNNNIVRTHHVSHVKMYDAYFLCIIYILKVCKKHNNFDLIDKIIYDVLITVLQQQFDTSNDNEYFKQFAVNISTIDKLFINVTTFDRNKLWSTLRNTSINVLNQHSQYVLTLWSTIIQKYQNCYIADAAKYKPVFESYNTLFFTAYKAFVQNNNNDAIQLCCTIADNMRLSTITQYNTDNNVDLTTFIYSQLLPATVRLHTLKSQQTKTYIINLLQLAYESLDNINDQEQFINQLIQQIQTRNKPQPNTVITIVNELLTKIIKHSYPLLDDIILEYAELFIQCKHNVDDIGNNDNDIDNSDSLSLLSLYKQFYTNIFINPYVVSIDVLITIISSFYDIIGYWIQDSILWSYDSNIDDNIIIKQFEQHTGASIDCLPYIASTLQTLFDVNNDKLQRVIGQEIELRTIRLHIANASFWISNITHVNAIADLQQPCQIIIQQCCKLLIFKNVINDVHNKLKDIFNTIDINSINNDTFETTYVTAIQQLLQCTKQSDNTIHNNTDIDSILTDILPQHTYIEDLLLQNTPDSISRLLAVNDCILSLSHRLTPAVLFDSQSTIQERSVLIIDLYAIHYHSTYFINNTYYIETAVQHNNVPKVFQQLWRAVPLQLSTELLQHCVKTVIKYSTTIGWMYSRVLNDILGLAIYHAISYQSLLQQYVYKPLHDTNTFTQQLTMPIQHTIHGLSSIQASNWLVNQDGTFNTDITQFVNNIENVLSSSNTNIVQCSGVISVLASIITTTATSDITIINAPQYLLDDHSALLTQLDNIDRKLQYTDTMEQVTSILRARIRLLHSTLLLRGELDSDTNDIEPVTMKRILHYITSAIDYAANKHISTTTTQQYFSRDYMYLEPAITLLRSSTQHMINTNTQPDTIKLIHSSIQFLLSSVVNVLNVQRYDKLLSNLGNVLVSISNTSSTAQTVSSILTDKNQINSNILFQLLSHQHSSIALASQSLLTYGILYNATQATLNSNNNDTLSSDDKSYKLTDFELFKKRAVAEKQLQEQQLQQLLPQQLISVLNTKLILDDDVDYRRRNKTRHNQYYNNDNSQSIVSINTYSNMPAALQLRAHLLCWHITIQLLHTTISALQANNNNATLTQDTHNTIGDNNATTEQQQQQQEHKLSYEKKSIILTYLCDNDIAPVYLNEFIEHIIVVNNENDLYNISSLTFDSSMLQPTQPVTTVRSNTTLTKRYNALRNSDDDLSDYIFYGQLCSYLYLHTLRYLPAISRQWYTNNVERGNINEINRMTSSYYTPILIQNELKVLDQFDQNDDEFVIKCNYDTGNVRAIYKHEEIEISLMLSFPSNYPLLPIQVTLDDKLVLRDNTSKKWQLSIQRILSSHDSTLYDAIVLWRSNITKQFSGVEECPICYNIVSTQNRTLPSVECSQCHNKFHSSCLYKWFNSSGNSKCPMCRNIF